ncbi:hypothetical protein J6X90_02340 [Candidatus Saccharibacteria bacterium]|nr:hypothetical protein [Candidatus Saccharibacteria bacterium]
MSMEEKYTGTQSTEETRPDDTYDKSNCFVIYNQSGWSIYLRYRNHVYADEPNLKVWVARDNNPAAQYSEEYRGYNRYKLVKNSSGEIVVNGEEFLPEVIRQRARKAWKDVCAGVYTLGKLAEMRAEFIEEHDEFKRAAEKRLKEQLIKEVS